MVTFWAETSSARDYSRKPDNRGTSFPPLCISLLANLDPTLRPYLKQINLTPSAVPSPSRWRTSLSVLGSGLSMNATLNSHLISLLWMRWMRSMTREGWPFLKSYLIQSMLLPCEASSFWSLVDQILISPVSAFFRSKTVCRLYDVPRATIQGDIMTYLKAELPALKDHEQLMKLADKADGLFIYAATAVGYITPHSNMTKDEQLQLIGELLDDVSLMFESADTPSLVDILYKQILWTAFSKLNNNLFRTCLNILHTILCAQRRVSTSVVARLHAGSDDMRDVVVEDLHADGRALSQRWLHLLISCLIPWLHLQSGSIKIYFAF